jgi:hypothetical protein
MATLIKIEIILIQVITALLISIILFNPNLKSQSLIIGPYGSVKIEDNVMQIGGNLNVQAGGTIIVSSGTLKVKGNILNDGNFYNWSNVELNGTFPQTLYGFSTYNNLDVNNTSGIVLNGSTYIEGNLNFTNGKITLGNYNLTVNSFGNISGYGSTRYVVTNGAGMLRMPVNNDNVPVVFPVGISGSYNPVSIKLNPSSSPNNFSVRVKNTFDHNPWQPELAVKRQWDISKNMVGLTNTIMEFQFNENEWGTMFTIYGGGEIGLWNNGYGGYDIVTASLNNPSPGIYKILNSTSSYITFFSSFIVGNQGTNPIHLTSFNYSINQRDVNLKWITEGEIDNYGFEIERRLKTENNNLQWTKIGFEKGYGTTNQIKEYKYIDKKLNTGKYEYRLKQIDYNGTAHYISLNSLVEILKPSVFALHQNYPNPFNPVTKIDFEIPNTSKVTLKLFDITGREVLTMLNDALKESGYYTMELNGTNLSSGTYFCKLISGNFLQIKKLMLIK